MQEPICLSEEQRDELVYALREEGAHLLVIGGTAADHTALLSHLAYQLEGALPIVKGGEEAHALAHVRQWLARVKSVPAQDHGWCEDGVSDIQRCAVVLDSPAREGMEQIRRQLGDHVQFILTLPEATESRVHEELLKMLEDRVLEVRLDTPRAPTPALSPQLAHRLEVVLVGVILVLVGLSTLWLADSAVSEPTQEPTPAPVWTAPVWSVRP